MRKHITRKLAPAICDFCGIEFIKRADDKGRKFCSMKCRGASSSLARTTELTCPGCGIQFRIANSQIEYRGRTHCSRKCMVAARTPSESAKSVIALYKEGRSSASIATQLCLTYGYVRTVYHKYLETDAEFQLRQARREARHSGKCSECRTNPAPSPGVACAECVNASNRASRKALREQILDEYGGKCACCGENERAFLTLDHINNDGALHRKQLGSTGAGLYSDVRKKGFPKDRFQLLCWNCNCAKGQYGKCPHEITDNE